MGSKTWLLFVVVCAAALAVGWIVWLQPSAGAQVSVGGEKPAASSPASDAPLVGDLEPATRRPTVQATPSPASTPSSAPAPKPEVPAASAERRTVTLVATFSLPDHTKIRIERAGVDLVDAAGAIRHVEAQNASSVEIPGLAPGAYTVHAESPGYEHREQTIELKGDDKPEERIVLWPADWIPVIVETSDGQPFSAIAEGLGLEPMKLFVGAFQVHTRISAPDAGDAKGRPGDASAGDDTALAKFRPPPAQKSWEITRSCVGSLQLLRPAPLWVGLDVFGTPREWLPLLPGQREIVFHLDVVDVEPLFARVALRVVDASDRSPVAQALVTLRADSSTLRRKDQSSVPTGSDGRLELARIVPGRYELEILRGESQHQEMIELRPSERRDLGDVPLGNAAGFDVLVVDARGEPASAYVEIGPYKKGARNGDIYPQMMRHRSDEQGRCRLPMPSDPVIVRAAVELGRSNGPKYAQELFGERSPNVFLDPRSVPTAPIRLQIEASQPVKLTTSRPDGTRFEVLDELDVVVARSVRPDDHTLSIELVPGRYRLRGVSPDGSAGPELAFTIQHDPATIALD